jgi:hypothetical protein
MKKQILKISGIALVAVLVLTSCSKKVTSRKLDGDWSVTSGVGTFVQTENGIALTDNLTFDGSKITEVDYTGDTYVTDQTMSYSFDKKEGTYTQTTTYIDHDTNFVSYYTFDGTNYNYAGEYEATSIENETEVNSGTYTITGGTGEIKKNSQIVLSMIASNTTTNTSYKYFDGLSQVTNFTGLFVEVFNYDTYTIEYKAMSSSSVQTMNSTGSSYYAEVINVESITKDEIVINIENTSNSGTSGYSVNMQYTLSQK